MVGPLVSLLIVMAQAPAAAAPRSRGRAAAAARLDVKAVVAEVQKRYDGAADFRARFTQTLTSAAMGRKTNSAGEVMFKKPGRMRWDYEKPEKSSYITDGGVLWLYEPDDKQAFKQELEGVAAAGGAVVPDRQGEAGDGVRHRVRRQVALRQPGRLRAVAVTQGGRRRRSRRSCSSSIRAPSTCARASSPTGRGTSTISCSPTFASTRACRTRCSSSRRPRAPA